MLTNTPDMSTVEAIVANTMNGSAHFAAWTAVCDAIQEVAPEAFDDSSKSPVEAVVAWIKSQGAK